MGKKKPNFKAKRKNMKFVSFLLFLIGCNTMQNNPSDKKRPVKKFEGCGDCKDCLESKALREKHRRKRIEEEEKLREKKGLDQTPLGYALTRSPVLCNIM